MASNNYEKSDNFSNENSIKQKAENDLKMQALNRLRSMEWKRNQSDKWHLAGSSSRIEKGQGDCDLRYDSDRGVSRRSVKNKTHQCRKQLSEPTFFPQRESHGFVAPKVNAWEKKKGAELFLKPEDLEERAILNQVIAESLRTAEEDKRRAEEWERQTKWDTNFTLQVKELTFDESQISDVESSETEKEDSPTKNRGLISSDYRSKTYYNKKHEKETENKVLQVDRLATHIASSLNISKEPTKTEVKDDERKRAKEEKPKIQTNRNETTKLPIDDDGDDDMYVEQYLRFEISPQVHNTESDPNVQVAQNSPQSQNQSELDQTQVLNMLNQLTTIPKNSPAFETLVQSMNQFLIQQGLETNASQHSAPNLQHPPYSAPSMYTQVNPNLPYVPTCPNVPIVPQYFYPYTGGYLSQYSPQDVTQPFCQQNQLLTPLLQNQPGYVPYTRLPETQTNTMERNNSSLPYSLPDTSKPLVPNTNVERCVPINMNGSEENDSQPDLSLPQACPFSPDVQTNGNQNIITYLLEQTDRLLEQNTAGIVMTAEQINCARVMQQSQINSTGQVIPQDRLNSATQEVPQTQLYSAGHVMPGYQIPPHAMSQPFQYPMPLNYPQYRIYQADPNRNHLMHSYLPQPQELTHGRGRGKTFIP